jgi:ribose/xylose/arabinose/galactoside ABC-type transport system permease subunit
MRAMSLPSSSSASSVNAMRKSSRKFRLGDLILPAFIVVLSCGTALVEPKFSSASNASNLASQIAPLAILAVGQAFAIISGGLDLSMSAIMSLAGIIGVLTMPYLGIPAGIALIVITGALAGAANGILIAYLGRSPLIITLGMLSICQAIALILSNGVPLYSVPERLTAIVGFGTVYQIPVSSIIAVSLMLASAFILRRTVLGRYIYAIGSNRSSAMNSGVDVKLYIMLVYVISGIAAGVASIVITSWTGAAQPIAEPNMTLQSLAAVVLGGVALTGGSGGMLHVLYGVLILGILSNAMNMLGISAYYQTLGVGIVIIVAVVLDKLRGRER